MACCGQQRAAAALPTAPASPPRVVPTTPPARGRSTVRFEYRGVSVLTVVGPVTGIRYRFDARVAPILDVDVRDRAGLATVPQLRVLG